MHQAAGETRAPGAWRRLGRGLRHLMVTRWSMQRAFTPEVLAAIEEAIRAVESLHAGEIRFAIETALDPEQLFAGITPRERALQVFAELGVWDTADNNGVLIYVLFADHDVEIVADRGIAARVTQQEWSAVCHEIESLYRDGRFAEGSTLAVRRVGELLARHFPGRRADRDELPNQPVLL